MAADETLHGIAPLQTVQAVGAQCPGLGPATAPVSHDITHTAT